MRALLVAVAVALALAAASCGHPVACVEASDCPAGRVCNTVSKLCYDTCADVSNRPADLFCQFGWRCQPNLMCSQPATCDPRLGARDCNGPICDATTKTCGAVKPCTLDSECDGLYSCDTFSTQVCNRSCSDSLACKQGSVCNSSTSLCN